MGRFLEGCPRQVCEYKFQDEQEMLTACNNANWASNPSDRRSVSDQILMHGSRRIKSWSKTQSHIALSPAESELYALVKASSEALGLSIRDQGPGTVVEHALAQRRQRRLG